MSEENISQGFRLKNIDETRNYLTEKINQKELISKKHKKFIEYWIILNYINFYSYWMRFHLLFLFLVGIPIGIMSSAIGLKICAITAGIENYKSIIKVKKKSW